MRHTTAPEDREFLDAFEACEVAPEAFDHAAHVRLAYIYLCEHSVDSAATFMARNPRLLDSKIMLTHYSAEVLFSPEARQSFVQPDVQAIPEHGKSEA